MNEPVGILPDGRVLIDYGPVTMTLLAETGGMPLPKLCVSVFSTLQYLLKTLSDDLPLLRKPPRTIDKTNLNPICKTMLNAVLNADDPTLTPMAAVAGAVSDYIADLLFKSGAERVIVNNGGDIAIRLTSGQSVRLGIISDLKSGQIDRVMTIRAEDGVGGICTSGLGGRSLTRGIASAVTVLAATSAQADALATHLANATFVDDPAVKTVFAREADPCTDIPDLTVVTELGTLTGKSIIESLAQFQNRAHCLRSKFIKAVAYVQGKSCVYP